MTGREAGCAGPTTATATAAATTTATATATTTTATMSRSVLQPSQQKLAEKLTILNDRGVGMLTRLYNITKVRTGRRGLGGAGGQAEAGWRAGEAWAMGAAGAARGRKHGLAAAGPTGVAGMRRGLMRSPGVSPAGSRAGQGRRGAICPLPALGTGRPGAG